jgi:hypothetical protein
MALTHGQIRDVQERATRFRRFSALFGEDQFTSPLRALAIRLEQQLEPAALDGGARASYIRVLVVEVDTFLARAKTALDFAKYRLRPACFTADEVREASQLCRDEARMATEEEKRSLALRALELAQLAEKMERDFGGS